MRWKVKPEDLRKAPKPGDQQRIMCFAWLPKRLDDDFVVWLEDYIILQEWCLDEDYRLHWKQVRMFVHLES